MEGPPLGPGGEDITWPDQVAPRGRKASSTRKIKPQTSNHNGDPEIAVRVSQASPPLIFNTSNEVICCLIQRYWLNVLCASLCLSRQLCTEGPRCRRLQNIGDACSMPLLQIQTRCASLLPNLCNRFHAVLSRYTPIIAICKYETRRCARARATRRANSRLTTYCYLPRERRVMGLLAVLLRVTQFFECS